MNLLEALNAAQNKIRNPNNWARGARARNAFGYSVDISAPTAVSFDITAAILLTVPTDAGLASSLRDLLRRSSNELFLCQFNDDPNTTHDDLMRMFDDARSYYHAYSKVEPA